MLKIDGIEWCYEMFGEYYIMTDVYSCYNVLMFVS